MRLFIAINFDDAVKNQIINLQEKLHPQVLQGKFSKPENLHLTLVFLGETPAERLASLQKAIENVEASPFKIFFAKTGCFKRHASELWWLGASYDTPGFSQLQSIYNQLVQNLGKENFSFDRKPFNAHVTLAREITRQKPVYLNFQPVQINIEHISLMKSEHLRGVLTYTELFRKCFT